MLIINIILVLVHLGAVLFFVLAAFKKLPSDIQDYLEKTFFLNKKWAIIGAVVMLFSGSKILIEIIGL